MKKRRKLWMILRVILLITFLLFTIKDGKPDTSRGGVIKAQIEGYEFNYIAWELDALWQKAQQELFGFQSYMTDEEGKAVVIEYLNLVGRMMDVEARIETIYADPAVLDPDNASQQLQNERDRLEGRRRDLQPIAEPVIERQVSAVLIEEGFGTMGQILPPVSFRFVDPPDVLVISPRNIIRQDFAISLRPITVNERHNLEIRVENASPDDSAYVTGIGGVGIYPAMIIETRYPAFAFEIVAHEWSHHYLFLFPSGMEYLVHPETRIINETTATIFGNRVGVMVLERFYSDEVAQGLIWVPNYPTLADFQGGSQTTDMIDPDSFFPFVYTDTPTATDIQNRSRTTADYLLSVNRAAAAQRTLDSWQFVVRQRFRSEMDRDSDLLFQSDRGTEINRTRLTTDYLLAQGRVDAAESFMESRRQWLGMRVLNQAWFAFNGGYQADPGGGSGVSLAPVILDVADPNFVGDPTGSALHEIMALAPTLQDYLVLLRDVTTRDELIQALINARQQWGNPTP